MTCIMIILSQFCAVTNMTTASRQLFSFARDRGTPFHTFFRSVSGSASVDYINLIGCFAYAIACTMVIIEWNHAIYRSIRAVSNTHEITMEAIAIFTVPMNHQY